MPKKFFIIACEPSGDLHGSLLVEELKKLSPGAVFQGLGGPKMQAAGVALLHDMTKMSALGFTDVLRQYFTYRKIFYDALGAVKNFKPDALILIDSPAFNLRFAKKIQKQIPVFYYIAPQIWAWGGRRIHTIKKTISKMLVILPFETAVYQTASVPCEFVGHPLIDETRASAPREELRKRLKIQEDETAIGLLPGSRKSEVERIFPVLLKTAAMLREMKPSCRFYLSRSNNVPPAIYEKILKSSRVPVEQPSLPFEDLVTAMDFAFVTSGTATLQTALLGTPFFLVYKASALTYELGKRLVRISYLGLVNLLAGRRIVPEFIQGDMHPKTMAHEAKVLLENEDLTRQMKWEFQEVKEKLGAGGASRRAAEAILSRGQSPPKGTG